MKNKRFSISFVFIVLLFLFSGVLSWNLYFKVYRQKDTVDISVFPVKIGDWEAEELEVTDYEMEILETRNTFVRRYFNPEGQEVYLFIVYSQSNRKVSHPPEVCYTGGGATISKNVPAEIVADKEVVQARHLVIEKGKFEQVAFYWFKVGDSFTPNYWKQQGLIALKSFFGQPASSALVRLSATVRKSDNQKAIDDIKEFGQLIVPELYKYLP